MIGSVERNRNFYDQVLDLMFSEPMLSSGLNSTDVVRVLTAILIQIVAKAPPDQQDALRAQIYNRLIDHTESIIKQGQEPILYSAGDTIPDTSEMH